MVAAILFYFDIYENFFHREEINT